MEKLVVGGPVAHRYSAAWRVSTHDHCIVQGSTIIKRGEFSPRRSQMRRMLGILPREVDGTVEQDLSWAEEVAALETDD